MIVFVSIGISPFMPLPIVLTSNDQKRYESCFLQERGHPMGSKIHHANFFSKSFFAI